MNEYEETVAAMHRASDEMVELAGQESIGDGDVKRLEYLEGRFEKLDAERKAIEKRAILAGVSPATGKPAIVERGHSTKNLDSDPWGEPDSAQPSRRKFGDPWSLNNDEWSQRFAGPGEMRSRALDAMCSFPSSSLRRTAAPWISISSSSWAARNRSKACRASSSLLNAATTSCTGASAMFASLARSMLQLDHATSSVLRQCALPQRQRPSGSFSSSDRAP
jgi:hypothetical protein